jgi:tripartite-type tricarboxylate transporter receptor subunit TctC
MAKRAAVLPDVPTIAEGGLPGFAFEGFMGLAGPAGLPRELVMRLNTEVNNALADSGVRSRLLDSGLELAGGTPELLGERMRAYTDSMIRLAKEAGIQPVD